MNCDLGLRLVGGEGKTVRAQSWCQVSLTPHLQVRRERLRGGGHSGQSEVGSGSRWVCSQPHCPLFSCFSLLCTDPPAVWLLQRPPNLVFRSPGRWHHSPSLSGLPDGTVSGSRCQPLSPAPQERGPRSQGHRLAGPGLRTLPQWTSRQEGGVYVTTVTSGGPWLMLWVLRHWDSQAVVDRDLWPRLGHMEPHRVTLACPPLSHGLHSS